MKYVIQYEHLEDELITDLRSEYNFNRVKDSANKHRLELTDEEFKGFLKLYESDKDIGWLMNQMSAYKLSFTDALVSYINA